MKIGISAGLALVGMLLMFFSAPYSSFFLIILGLFDDAYDLSPYLRFIANILISALGIAFSLGIPYISNLFGGVIRLDFWQIPINFFGSHTIWVVADILAIIWLTWTTNMINWSNELPLAQGIKFDV